MKICLLFFELHFVGFMYKALFICFRRGKGRRGVSPGSKSPILQKKLKFYNASGGAGKEM